MSHSVRLAGGQAGYGDTVDPVQAQIEDGVDYLVCDALAESTLAVLQKDRQRDEALGYTRDVTAYVEAALPEIAEGRMRVITNAGGLNPSAATQAVVGALKAAGVTGLTVATVTGDDLKPLGDLLELPADVVFANAYLGAQPVAEALATGAQIVVTGRVADASLFLAPLVHEHGWAWDDWDRMAAGITVGHLLECSAQVSGAVYSGTWWDNPDPAHPGYPIAEVDTDGAATITKPKSTGGLVTFDTVREQLLYEVHDPRAYLNPDVTADFTGLRIVDLGDNRVQVTGAKGRPRPATYKALRGQRAGWAGDFLMGYSWPDAEAKARDVVAAFRARVDSAGLAVDEWVEEYFGAGAFHGATAAADLRAAREAGWEPPEVVVRVAWRCAERETARRVGACRGGHAPAMTSPVGRPKRRNPTELFRLHAFPAERKLVDSQVRVSVIDV